MIRLNLPRAPYWLDLPYGVRFRVRPITTAMWEQALAKARRLALELGAHAEAIETAGGMVSGLPSLDDPDARAGLSQMLFAQGLAQCGVIEWEGVGNEAGDAPLPVTEDTVGRVIEGFPEIATDFIVKYVQPMQDAISEGNGFGTSPNGTSAAVPIIAPGAEPTTSPAAGANP